MNSLYISTKDEINAVNDSIIIARPLYQNNLYIGMLAINAKMFDQFSDIIMNNMDDLTATTVKMRMMEQQIPILNPFYQFSPSVSYVNNKPESLIQTIPNVLNKYPQIHFNDVVSAKIITIPKVINTTSGTYTEKNYEYYQMQIIRKDLTIHMGLSSTAITTNARFAYSNNPACVKPQQTVFTPIPLNLNFLRQTTSTPFMRTRSDCIVTDGYKCLYKTDVDLYRLAKAKIQSQINSDIQYLCAYPQPASKFQLNLDTDDFLLQLQNTPEFGNISQLILDFNKFKNAVTNINYLIIGSVQLKYYNVVPSKQKQLIQQDTCVLVIQNGKFIPSSQFSSLRGLQTTSPTLLVIFNQMFKEVLHFSRYVNQLSYLLDNPLIKGVYLGHNWNSGVDYDYSDILEQKDFVIKETGTNPDQIVVNKVCADIAKLYATRYFVFSTNPTNNDIVKNEHMKSNIDGTNQKFRLSYIGDQIYLTKPLISKNKSLLGIPQVGGYLTLQMNVGDLFQKNLNIEQPYLVMDATGSVLYFQKSSEEYAFGIKRLLIQFGYLTESLSNSTIQTPHVSCTRNHKFWDTAFQRSMNNEFIVAVNQDVSRTNPVMTETDYNASAVFERSVTFNATSSLFSNGFITIKEFSVLNEFIVILDDVTKTSMTQIMWEEEQQVILNLYFRNLPQNISALDSIYPNLTSRSSRIPQIIHRETPVFESTSSNSYYLIVYIFITQILLLIYIKLSSYSRKKHSLPMDTTFAPNQSFVSQIQLSFEQNSVIYMQSSKTSLFTKNLQLRLQPFNFIFSEKNLSVLDLQRIQALIWDQDFKLLFKHLKFTQPEQIYKSFTVLCSQQQYAQFQMNHRNTESQISSEQIELNSNVQIIQDKKITFVPSKKYITINERNVSQLVTRLQTAMQSRVHSRPISRQDVIEEIHSIPFWFQENYYPREQLSVRQTDRVDFNYNIGLSMLNAEQLVKRSINIE
ncbi:Conserved_hypothetical protein [Hexamita inflata]|uniref:Uncharacterized protein n=1 Tax=Hexamita inflata TaxID=28002 RepID=A0AA86N616_9EUKA|nr:Conserved hypothetical protein [Hexamita inflata]